MMNYPDNVIIDCPNGRYTLVGRVSLDLCDRVPADRAAIMGQRWVQEGNETVEYKPIVRDTLAELYQAAIDRGYKHSPAGGPLGSFPRYPGPIKTTIETTS